MFGKILAEIFSKIIPSDMLLPKLIQGEVRVKDVERQL